MDPVQRGGPWTPGPCFVLTPFLESQRVFNPLILKAYVSACSAVFISVYAGCDLYGVE